jgi:hypothetical protein
LLSFNSALAKDSEYILKFVAVSRMERALVALTTTALDFAFPSPYLVGSTTAPDYAQLILTPKFRELKLNETNDKIQKKIDKLNKKITEEESKEKDTSKLKEKFHEIDYRLYKNPSWILNDQLISFIYIPLDGGIPKTITDVRITDITKQGLVCQPVIKEQIKFNLEDKKFLDDVYDIDLHDVHWVGYKVSFEPDCLVKDSVSKLVISFVSGKYAFDLDFGFGNKVKDVIRDDYGLKE